jgi:microcystin degradation protein MlrC
MARHAWERRQEFKGEPLKVSEAVQKAAALAGPVVLMDVGDNVGGGSSSDSTVLFEEILRQGISNALVVLYDPEAAFACVTAGVRQQVELAVGAKTDSLHGRPIRVKGRVRLISDGLLERSRSRGGRYACAGAAAELACLAEALKLVLA